MEDTACYALDSYLIKAGSQMDFQCPLPNCSSDGMIRKTLVKWLIAVNHSFQFSSETICLAVNYLDRVLNKTGGVSQSQAQLVGLTALWIASKVEEVEPADLHELVVMGAHTYCPLTFRSCERVMLELLDYRLHAPTLSYFLDYYFQMHWEGPKPEAFARMMVERVLVDQEFNAWSPSKIADTLFLQMTHAAGEAYLGWGEQEVRTHSAELIEIHAEGAKESLRGGGCYLDQQGREDPKDIMVGLKQTFPEVHFMQKRRRLFV